MLVNERKVECLLHICMQRQRRCLTSITSILAPLQNIRRTCTTLLPLNNTYLLGSKTLSMRWHNSGSIAHWRILLSPFYLQFLQISVWLFVLSLGSSLFPACRSITPSLPGFGVLSPLGQYSMWLMLREPLAASQLLTSCLISPIIY